MKILKYSKYSFLNNCKLNESEFLQYQFGIEPMGTQGGGGQYAFAQDPSLSYYNYQDSPFTDFYARQSGLISNLDMLIKNTRGNNIIYKNTNAFLDDIDLYKNLKILRIFENNNLNIDVFISFIYDDFEYFGVFKNFNVNDKPKFETELFYEPNVQYKINGEYKIRLSNFFYLKLEKWFIPEKGFYKNIKDDNKIKDNMGNICKLKSNQTIEVLGYNKNTDNKPYIIFKHKGNIYHIDNNDYYYFKWRFEKLN